MSKVHFATMDGLRGVAAICVLCFHGRFWMPGGAFMAHAYLAVDFFFMLSGFVVAYAYHDRLADGRLSLRSFVEARAIRLYPLIVLGAALGLSFAVARALSNHDSGALRQALHALPFAVLAVPTPASLARLPFLLNPPSWSLFYEIAITLGFAAGIRWFGGWRSCVLIALGAAGLVATALLHGNLDVGLRHATLLPAAFRVLFSFTAGVAIHRHRASLARFGLRLPFPLLAAVLVATFWTPGGVASPAYDLAIVMAVYPLLLVSAARERPGSASPGYLKAAGDVSYPLYILHGPLLFWAQALAPRTGLPTPVLLPAAGLAICLFAYVVGQRVDAPLRSWLARRSTQASRSGRQTVARS